MNWPEETPYLVLLWIVVAVALFWFTSTSAILSLVVSAAGTLLIPLVFAWTDESNDVTFGLCVSSVIAVAAVCWMYLGQFFGQIAWYIIGEPIMNLIESVMAAPIMVGTIGTVVAGIITGGILFTLWRTGITAKPLLIARMVLSLTILAAITLAFFTSIWRVFEYTLQLFFILVLYNGGEQSIENPEGFRNFVTLITSMLFVSLLYHEIRTINVVDRSADATPVTSEEYPTLHSIARTVATQLDIPQPTIVISENAAPEAIAVGYRPGNVRLVLSEGLLNTLDRAELEAVMAHELGHVVNMDAMVMTIAALPIHLAGGLKDRVNELRGMDGDSENDADQEQASQRSLLRRLLRLPLLLVLSPFLISWYLLKRLLVFIHRKAEDSPLDILWFVLLAIAYVTKYLSMPAIAVLSRARESAADRTAARVTGSPAALASALRTLDDRIADTPSEDLRTASDHASLSILPLDPIIDPAEQPDTDESVLSRLLWWLFATHPLTDKRIEALRELEAEQP